MPSNSSAQYPSLEQINKFSANLSKNLQAGGTKTGSKKTVSRPRRLEDLNKKELLARAEKKGVKGRTTMKKDKLIACIRGKK